MGGNIKYYKIIGFPTSVPRSAISFYKIDSNTRYGDIIRIWDNGYVENEHLQVGIEFIKLCVEITKEEYESVYEL